MLFAPTTLLFYLGVALVGAAPSQLLHSRADATFSLSKEQSKPFRFDFTAPTASDNNWVGIWHRDGSGPDNQEKNGTWLVYQYVYETEGAVEVYVGDQKPGAYKAYFLAKDGYKWLADPIELSLKEEDLAVYFPVQEITLRNAKKGEGYEASVGGLIRGGGGEDITFEKTSGDSWIQISSDGKLTGTPSDDAANPSIVEVKASGIGSSTATLKIGIPVKAADDALVSDLNVLSWNLWYGGTRVNNYHEKQLRFLIEHNIDIVGVQEATAQSGTSDHTTRLGEALGWYHWQASSAGIISRYPIVEEHGSVADDRAGGVRIDLSGSDVNIWSMHTNAYPYGPYDFCDEKKSKEEVMKAEEDSGRKGQVQEVIDVMKPFIANSFSTPVILVGDFNAPSHLDYVDGLKDEHCGISDFDWPTSKIPVDAGLVDSFREAHTDPVTNEGLTWSPIYPKRDGDTGVDEPQNRIDFVYHSKTEGLSVVDAEVVNAEAKGIAPHHRDNEWTSDHRAVLVKYRI